MAILRSIVYSLMNRRLKRSAFTRCVVPVILLTMAAASSAQSVPPREYQIKAAFLYNFAQFVEWPPRAFPDAQAPLIIGVLGQNPFGSYLEEIVRGEKINDHPLAVQRYRDASEAKNCHILFVNLTKADDLKLVFASLKSQSTLLVGDASNFIQQGGMIRFFTESSKTRIQVNLDAVKDAELVISTKLLRLADVVPPNN